MHINFLKCKLSKQWKKGNTNEQVFYTKGNLNNQQTYEKMFNLISEEI